MLQLNIQQENDQNKDLENYYPVNSSKILINKSSFRNLGFGVTGRKIKWL